MTAPAHRSKLRVDRDAPSPAERSALGRNLVLLAAAAAVVAGAETALIAGVIGCLLALPIDGVVTSATNWASVSEMAFARRVTPQLLVAGVVFAVAMGVVGRFLPARRASKLPVVQALR